MQVDHRCLQARVPQQLLNDANVVACLQEMGSIGVAKGVSADLFRDSRPADGMVQRILKLGFMEMVAPAFAGLHHHRKRLLRYWVRTLCGILNMNILL